MVENTVNERFELPDEWIPANDIECVDEIDDIVCMIAGLRNMFFEVTDALPCAKKDGIIWEGYKMIISRESGRVIKRLETVSETLLKNVQRRGRIRRVVRKKRERKTEGSSNVGVQ